MTAPVHVLVVLGDRIQMAAPMSADDLRDARAAVAELIEAANEVSWARRGAEDWRRLDAALARCGVGV